MKYRGNGKLWVGWWVCKGLHERRDMEETTSVGLTREKYLNSKKFKKEGK
jgi:hypothetical protein